MGYSPHKYGVKAIYKAVRGPMTQKFLNLGEEIVCGDPALLLPLIYPVQRDGVSNGVLYLRHHWNIRPNSRFENAAMPGVDRIVNMEISESSWFDVLALIANAKFILTGSLHGAVVAHAYGVPWAFCLPHGDVTNLPFKWYDWYAYLGLVFSRNDIVKNIEEGNRWWAENKSRMLYRSLTPLIKCFPYPVRNGRIKELVERAEHYDGVQRKKYGAQQSDLHHVVEQNFRNFKKESFFYFSNRAKLLYLLCPFPFLRKWVLNMASRIRKSKM